MPRIPYTPTGFPPFVGLSRARVETFGWAELVHSAVTVGRRNWSDVMQHGSYSVLELLWRVAMLRANLRANSFHRLVRSSAYDGLDPSEKGSVSFFIGMCIAKALCGRLFQVPWLLHLGVYRALLAPTFVTDDRPDFVGFDAANRSIVLEAKGRTRGVTNALLAKAKEQTQAISAIGGVPPTARVAMASYFSERGLRVSMVDPVEPSRDAVPIDLSPEALANLYYRHLFDFARVLHPSADLLNVLKTGVELPGFDARLQVADDVSRWFFNEGVSFDEVRLRRLNTGEGLGRYVKPIEEEAHRPRRPSELERPVSQSNQAFSGPDGITVLLGPSWSEDFMRREPSERGIEGINL